MRWARASRPGTLRELHARTHDRPGTCRFARQGNGPARGGATQEADSAQAIMHARRGARPCAVCCCRRRDAPGSLRATYLRGSSTNGGSARLWTGLSHQAARSDAGPCPRGRPMQMTSQPATRESATAATRHLEPGAQGGAVHRVRQAGVARERWPAASTDVPGNPAPHAKPRSSGRQDVRRIGARHNRRAGSDDQSAAQAAHTRPVRQRGLATTPGIDGPP